jgi:type IV pilus assembly protein PilB
MAHVMIQTGGLGRLLIRDGVITPAQLESALSEQRTTRERLGEILCRRGDIKPDDLASALARQLGHGRFDAARDVIDPAALELVPAEVAQRLKVLPVRLEETAFVVALADPLDVEACDQLRQIAERAQKLLKILVGTPEAIAAACERHYSRVERSRDVNLLIEKVVGEARATSVGEAEGEGAEGRQHAQDAGIVRLVDSVVQQAVQERATDIHIEPTEKGLLVRYRVDGMLYDTLSPPRAVYTGMVCRIKILANMDIAESRVPQDGRFTVRGGARDVDVRVSSVPTIHGEKIVLRLLDKSGGNLALRELGLRAEDYEKFQRALRNPHGMILLSGPTGSGKSTTLYAGLLELRGEALNIMTVEDPVEYQMERINQVQVNERKKVSFAVALRSFLRQDPDVIMVGEVRDTETAEIAVRAALTGHLVLSSIHANDAPSTAARLVSMGVEPFMTASALTLVASQRLVRRICKQCTTQYEPEPELALALGLAPEAAKGGPYVRGVGCAACKGRGYQGRLAVVEVMSLSPRIRQLVAEKRPAGDIREAAIADGMLTLKENGLAKVAEGLTTLEEVLRVCLRDE